jgi:hypothetical protein
MAYLSNETGADEVHVQTFPLPGHKRRVSSTGASAIWWRRDGKQLLFASKDRSELRLVDVVANHEFAAGTPRTVGHLPKGVTSLDATPDLKRVLALVNEGSTVESSITVVQNWSAALR